jgi:hypothetical protein
MKSLVRLGAGALAVSGLSLGCQSDATPASSLETVRILAVRTDTPYAAPGARVTAEVLGYDGRADQGGRAMRISWLRDLCVAPKDDLVSECYRRMATRYANGQELDSLSTPGALAAFDIPADAIAQAPRRPGPTQFATAFVFVAACAGSLRWVGARSTYPDEVPVGCFDTAGNRLGATDFVFAHARIFVYADRTNRNPEIDAVKLDGMALSADAPIEIERCSKNSLDDCPERKIEVELPDTASEIDQSGAVPGAPPDREQVWASFFATRSKLKNEAVILFDSRRGRLGKAENTIKGPIDAGDVDLFVVTHDNRSGVSWKKFVLRAR